VQEVDGNDLDRRRGITAAKSDRGPAHSHKNSDWFGSPNKAGTAKAHGEPLGPDEVKLSKQALGWPFEERSQS
jgi:transketolase